jgi:regulation of enolase protein 1 (concanavalin A-like superfamily)
VASVTVTPGNTPPAPSISSPSATARFAVGQPITLRGSAIDAQDGTLADSRLSWTVILHHNEHTHPFLGPVIGNGLTFQAPAPEDLASTRTSYLEIRLTATDSQGASATVLRNFQPRLVDVTYNTAPSGLRLTVGGTSVSTPQTLTSWEGYPLVTVAPTQKDAAGQAWLFGSWADGGTFPSRTIVTPAAPASYSAGFMPASALSPAADAYVRNGVHAATSFGIDPALIVKHSANADNQRQSYLRFSIGTRSVERAVLRLHGGLSSAGSVPVPAFAVANTAWSESGLTWNTRPPRGSTALATTTVTDTTKHFYEWDVTAYVRAERAAGRTAVGFALIGTVATTPYANFSSRNAASNRPELFIAGQDGLPSPLPPGWQARDIGAVGLPGSATGSGGSMTVSGAGADVWGTSDAFHYAYIPLAGDGTVTAQVSSITGAQAWTKVGVMIRASTAADSAHAFMLVSTSKGLAFQRRRTNGATSVHTSGGSGTAPRWVRLVRRGNVITASVSTTGASWTTVASDTISLPSTALLGVAVSSHEATRLATGSFDNVRVEAGTPGPDPSGWQARDIGAVGQQGSTAASGNSLTVSGAGADVWGTADAFHFASTPVTGDGAVTAQVSSITGAQAWTKVGVMVRGATAADAAHGFMLVSTSKGLAFQRRVSAGRTSVHTAGGSGTAPRWVRLTRRGNLITAYVSATGTSWTTVGSATIELPTTALFGVAVSSHDPTRLATGVFDNVSVHIGMPAP